MVAGVVDFTTGGDERPGIILMFARGGLDQGGDRAELVPRGTIALNNVYRHDALGFSDADRRRIRRCVRFAINWAGS